MASNPSEPSICNFKISEGDVSLYWLYLLDARRKSGIETPLNENDFQAIWSAIWTLYSCEPVSPLHSLTASNEDEKVAFVRIILASQRHITDIEVFFDDDLFSDWTYLMNETARSSPLSVMGTHSARLESLTSTDVDDQHFFFVCIGHDALLYLSIDTGTFISTNDWINEWAGTPTECNALNLECNLFVHKTKDKSYMSPINLYVSTHYSKFRTDQRIDELYTIIERLESEIKSLKRLLPGEIRKKVGVSDTNEGAPNGGPSTKPNENLSEHEETSSSSSIDEDFINKFSNVGVDKSLSEGINDLNLDNDNKPT